MLMWNMTIVQMAREK